MIKHSLNKKAIAARTIAIIVAVIIVIAVVSIVGYYLTRSPSPQVAGTIKIGFTISLTGTFSVEGTSSLNGIKAITKWINDNGGVIIQGKHYNITFVYYDDQSQSSNIVPLYTRLITQDGVEFLLAPYSSPLTSAAAPLADQYNIIMISHGGAADSIWKQGYKNVFGVLTPASGYLKPAIDWLSVNHPEDKLAFIYAGDSFSVTASKAALNYALQKHLTVVYNQTYPTSATDLTPLLQAAKSAGADAIIGGGHFNDGQLIIKQLDQIGWKPKFICLLVAVTEPAFYSSLGNLANLVCGSSQWESSVKYSPAVAQSLGIEYFGPSIQDFVNYYKMFSTNEPTYHSAEAAAAVLILVKAIEVANSLNTTAVRQALLSLHIMTFFGEYKVDSTGIQIAHSMLMIQWQNGSLKVVYPPSFAETNVIYPYGS